MYGIRVIWVIFLLFCGIIPVLTIPGSPKRGLMSKKQILLMLDESIRKIIDQPTSEESDKKSLAKYISLTKSLSVCMSRGRITKSELVSCINSSFTDLEIVPPPQLIHCLGDYLICTGKIFLKRIRKNPEDDHFLSVFFIKHFFRYFIQSL
uniref:Uncharacterized protein n=1 Tax=Theileria annulata TaxID=5874 RepID=A0A3B0MGC7_THEAN